jgi:DNA invertase Pin-like site-specific DNA recombinase
MKSVKVAVYLQNYYSEDSEEHLNKAEKTLIEYISNESSWEYAGAFKDSDRNFPSYHLERLVREAKKKSIEVILVGSLSKFNESLNNAMDTIHEILSMGIRIIFFEEGIDSSTVDGKMLLEKLRSTLAIEKKLASVSRKWTGLATLFWTKLLRTRNYFNYSSYPADFKVFNPLYSTGVR